MLEQILQLLPQPCMYSNKGCSSLAAANHLQYCEYRPITCVLGSDYSCSWLGTVKDWINHVKNNHSVRNYPGPAGNLSQRNCYENFSSWIVRGSCHCFDNKYFLVFAVKKNGMLYQTVKLVPLVNPNCQYFLETTIRNIDSNEVLYRTISKAGLLLENESFENSSTSFALEDLNGAMSQGNLFMSRKFTKH